MTVRANTPGRARDRLIVALDVASVVEAQEIVAALSQSVTFYKIGYQLAFAGGLDLAKRLTENGSRVFLDMKLLDIDHTVARAVENIARMGVTFLTLHAYPKTMAAAVAARADAPLKLLGVTVLTSMDDGDLARAGYRGNTADLVATRTRQAVEAGMDGIICAATDAAALRPIMGSHGLIVTPGIRPSGSATGDQKRVATPADAIAAGADYLVVGRPIIGAPDRRAAADAITREITAATPS
jgi:orotidine-5'-phosphate decarboxylase